MIDLNGDNLIRLLARPEWDEEVLELTEKLGLGRIKKNQTPIIISNIEKQLA